jgi:hypothetical protein
LSRLTNSGPSTIAAVIFLVLAAALYPTRLDGQSIWLRTPLDRGTTIEFDRVAFSGDKKLTTFSLAYYFGTHLPIRRDLVLVGELPIASAKVSGQAFSNQAVGNAYVGVEWQQTDALVWEIGARLPFGDNPFVNQAAALGLASDAADRLEAWADRAVSFQLAPNLIHRSRDGLFLRLRGGPSLFLPTGGATGDTEVIVGYGGQVGFEGDLIHLLGGVSGRVTTGSGGETFNHVVASIGFDFNGLRPIAFVRVPFGDLEEVNAVYGIALSFGS